MPQAPQCRIRRIGYIPTRQDQNLLAMAGPLVVSLYAPKQASDESFTALGRYAAISVGARNFELERGATAADE
jgi:hypothetical protein